MLIYPSVATLALLGAHSFVDASSWSLCQYSMAAGRRYWSWQAFKLCRGHRAYLEPMALVEASVAILAGVLIWLGFWDSLTCAASPYLHLGRGLTT